MDVRVTQFQQWLRQHREIAECTISKHGRMAKRLLVALGPDPTHYTAASIRQAILDEVRGTPAAHVKTMPTALRGYLRFLEYRVPTCLEQARQIGAIPMKRTDQALIRHLNRDKLRALLDALEHVRRG